VNREGGDDDGAAIELHRAVDHEPRTPHTSAVTAPTKKRATYADLASYPEGTRVELIDGDLYAQPRPAALHARAETRLAGHLDERLGGGGPGSDGWIILVEPELHLHGDALVPDVAGWRRTRMRVLPDVTAFELAPDWVCEILSPSSGRIDRTLKLPVYAREGVAHLWLVNPSDRSLEAFALRSEKWMLLGMFSDDDKIRVEPFADVELDLSVPWAR